MTLGLAVVSSTCGQSDIAKMLWEHLSWSSFDPGHSYLVDHVYSRRIK